SSQEVEAAGRQGIYTASLGPRILRTETAGLVAASIILYECGDLGYGCQKNRPLDTPIQAFRWSGWYSGRER
ncbi:MAG: 16S rRNA (uracil(1498)-N(3))-methyltransferase, partial [Syntrophomonadaceae bacterium]